MTSPIQATLAAGVLYLVGLRVLDFHEKEPLWAIGGAFAVGALGAGALHAGVSSPTLTMGATEGVLLIELARLLAVGIVVAGLEQLGRKRGWSEIDGLMDGVIYGAACGLGFAVGQGLATQIGATSLGLEGDVASRHTPWVEAVLAGLDDAVFGAVAGLGLTLASQSDRAVTRFLAPALAFGVMAVAHLMLDQLAFGQVFAEGANTRKWVALGLPGAVVAVGAIVALRGERRDIAEQLADEVETGAIDDGDVPLLLGALGRQKQYLGAIARGRFGRWLALHALHNRQVQLALAKARAARERNEARRAARADEVARLREHVLAQKQALAEGEA